MRRMTQVFGWLLSGALTLGTAQSARACAFHGYTPNPTLVDILLATEQVVIAKPDAADPKRYTPLETLAGPNVSTIPIPVEPSTQLLLAGRPAATVLLARDGSYGPWLEIAVLDDGYRQFIGQILRQQSHLLLGGDRQRVRLFTDLVNDPNADIRRLALQELDRVPYGELKKARVPAIRTLRQDLKTSEADLRPIRILLAGLSDDRGFSPYLSDGLERAIQRELPHMGAYAVALVELEGRSAVDMILDRHLRTASLSATTQERLLQALAIQYKTAPEATRRVISRGVTGLVRDKPQLGEIAARQFGFQSRGDANVPDIQR